MILKARAANGSLSSARRSSTADSSPTLVPWIGGTSSGEGRYHTTASSSGWTPLFLKALPHRTGVILPAMVAQQLDQPVAPLGGELDVLVGDRPVLPGLAHAVARPVVAAHLDQVDDAVEVALDAPGELEDCRGRAQAVDDHVHRAVELGPDPVHLVDEADPGDVVLVGLAPDRLGLGLDPADGVEHGHP